MNDIIAEELMDRINSVGEQLLAASRWIDEYEEGSDVYRVSAWGRHVSETDWERIWEAYPECWRSIWQLSGDVGADALIGADVVEVMAICDDPDWTPDEFFYTTA